jgi:putative transposase
MRDGIRIESKGIESRLHTLLDKLTKMFDSRAQARQSIFEYIEVWYNRQRRHSALGYSSPETYEQRHFESKRVSTKSG